MASRRANRSTRPSTSAVRAVAFDRGKYGRHLLVDVARVRELAGFISDDTPHALEFFDVMLVTRGAGRFRLDGHAHAVKPGAVLFTRPGQVRQWEAKGLDGTCLFFEDTFVTEFLRDDGFMRRLPFFEVDASRASIALAPPAARRLGARLDAMRRELAHYRRDSHDLLRAQLHEVLVLLAREYADAHGVTPQRATHPVVSRFVELVERDVTSRKRVADYAAELSVTPGHLSVLCSEFLGERAKRVIDKAIVTRARRMLLYDGATAAQVAAALGFADPSYFSRFFRRESGQSPSEARSGARLIYPRTSSDLTA